MKECKWSQDELYKFLTAHNMTISMIVKKMGVSDAIVRCCFNHTLNRHGKPLSFSKANIVKLNDAIWQIASELEKGLIHFGSDQTYTNQQGTTYDPGTLPAINNLGDYFNMKALTERLLGWKKAKRDTVLAIKKSPVYGNVTKEDVDSINAELLAISGMLSRYEVVADGEE